MEINKEYEEKNLQIKKGKFAKIKKIAELKQYLSDHDYLVNKVVLGELDGDSKEFQDYLVKRKEAIAKINELEEELKQQ